VAEAIVTASGLMFKGSPGKGLGNYDIDHLDIEADGRFEVIFSTERPEGHEGNWLRLDPEADFILLRQFNYRWGVRPTCGSLSSDSIQCR